MTVTVLLQSLMVLLQCRKIYLVSESEPFLCLLTEVSIFFPRHSAPLPSFGTFNQISTGA